MTADSTHPLTDAIHFWEPRRLLYTAILTVVVVLWFLATWPHFRPAINLSAFIAFAILGLLANLCYCAAYLADALIQAACPPALIHRVRWAFWILGTLFALLLENYWIADEIYPSVPNDMPNFFSEMHHMSPIATNLNFPAPVAVLAFLAAGGGLFLATAIALVAWFTRKPQLARIVLTVAGAGALFYALLLTGFSLASHQTTLARAQEKYFCEIDCHLAYSVADTQLIDAKPSDTQPTAAHSADAQSQPATTRYVVTLRTRFDETTTSPNRPKDATLTPSPRRVLLFDQAGHAYPPVATSGTPLLTPIKPAESFTTTLEFALPPGAKPARLLVSTDPAWEDRIVIGDENSLLHAKTYFAL